MIQELLAHLRNTCPVRINYALLHDSGKGSIEAVYRADLDEVKLFTMALLTSNSTDESVLFHELAHSTGRSNRLRRFSIVCVENQDEIAYYADMNQHIIEEIIAENVAKRLLYYFNLDTEKNIKAIHYFLKCNEMRLTSSIDHAVINSQINEAYNYILQNWLIGFNISKAA